MRLAIGETVVATVVPEKMQKKAAALAELVGIGLPWFADESETVTFWQLLDCFSIVADRSGAYDQCRGTRLDTRQIQFGGSW